MKERLRALRQRLVVKVNHMRFRMEDLVENFFGRMKVYEAFNQLRATERDPPKDEFSILLNIDDEAERYMTKKEVAEYRARLLRVREHCHRGDRGPIEEKWSRSAGEYFLTEEDLDKEREKVRSYKF